MVAISRRTVQDMRLCELRDLLNEQREKQLAAAACTCKSCASSGQFFLGSAKGLQFALAAIDEALAQEAIDLGRISESRDVADVRENIERQNLDRMSADKAGSQGARSAPVANGRCESPPVEGSAGGVFCKVPRWVTNGVALFGWIVILSWVAKVVVGGPVR